MEETEMETLSDPEDDVFADISYMWNFRNVIDLPNVVITEGRPTGQRTSSRARPSQFCRTGAQKLAYN